MKSKGVVLDEGHLEQAARGRSVGAGHGLSSKGIESLAPRNSAREGALPPMPKNSGQRLDTTIPEPRTKHTLSNTGKAAERFYAGHGDSSGLNATRPIAPTMQRPLDPNARASTIDSSVPIHGRQLPHPDLMTKADEERFAEDSIGNEPSGTLDR